MSAKPKTPPIQFTLGELRWLHGHLVDLLGGSGYFYRGVTARRNAGSVRDKLHAHLWPSPEKPAVSGSPQAERDNV